MLLISLIVATFIVGTFCYGTSIALKLIIRGIKDLGFVPFDKEVK